MCSLRQRLTWASSLASACAPQDGDHLGVMNRLRDVQCSSAVLYMYICIYLHVYIYIHTYLYIYAHTYTYLYMYTHTHIRIHILTCIYTYMSRHIPKPCTRQAKTNPTLIPKSSGKICIPTVCMYVCRYAYRYMYMYIWVCMHMYSYSLFAHTWGFRGECIAYVYGECLGFRDPGRIRLGLACTGFRDM